MILGFLDDIIFSVSDSTVKTFQDMGRSTSARIEYHSPINGKPVAEFIGPDTQSITFSMDIREQMGVNVVGTMSKLRKKCEDGDICSLVLGISYFGDWIIESVGESHKNHNKYGAIVSATVDVTIKDGV